MKLSVYAEKLGITYQTAYKWYKEGKIEGAYQTVTGTIIIPECHKKKNRTKTVVYARVSSNEQRKTDLETQSQRIIDFCIANGWVVDKVIKEVGSGLNDGRKQLVTLLKDPTVARIVLEHRDRLTRFGFKYLEILAEIEGFEIVVAKKTIDNDSKDLMADFTSIITSFCARLYNQRRGKKKADAVKLVLAETEE